MSVSLWQELYKGEIVEMAQARYGAKGNDRVDLEEVLTIWVEGGRGDLSKPFTPWKVGKHEDAMYDVWPYTG